ncbi:D-alanyl-D-alanine carboxypeptidase family protein [Effusibacillus dendaii]|uniref:serine-type D-Ala-D-Ala carboxypeptidase n=1 Tax=Effusibacillus dendaii TaxID=2743772 RepID=A0A7I8DAH1_9BACL|nr:D-alanyl-D-alanine carboxypeptidase family protein [Effusibacillus dendaii]BCJ85806.1 serine-type D-Ala-D-Ala carboxypeptidase [Effusibacillus dendaii]
MMRKLIIWVLALLLIVTMLPLFAFAAEPAPSIQSESGFLIDLKSGQVLYSKNENERLYPASITKIMTAILALENSKLDEQVVTSKRATEQEGNRIYLVEGETQSMENMLYGLLLNSGNDAAIAIAEHVAGSVEKFADMMNQKAKELGATNTHFVTPNGLHDPQHYTTAHDMTLIARYAMQNPKFREIVATETRPWHGKEWESVLNNINPMLYNYEGATGVKTGFTDQAMQTMVFSAKRGDRELIGTLMFAQTKQAIRLDATALLDYGFANFNTRQIAAKDKIVSTNAIHYTDDLKTSVKTGADLYYTYPAGSNPNIQSQIKLNPPAKPPLQAGSVVGSMEFTADGKPIGSVPLLADQSIPSPTFTQRIAMLHVSRWWYALLPAPFLFIGFIYRRTRFRSTRELNLNQLQDYRNQNYF